MALEGKSGGLQKRVAVTIYRDFPAMAIFNVEYSNQGKARLAIRGWSNGQYVMTAHAQAQHPAFWSYQSGSYQKRPNWTLPLHPGFHQDNFLGMNASDYGGGTPVVDVWSKNVGLAVGHVEPGPRLISLPISMPDATHAHVAVRSKKDRTSATTSV